MSKRALPPSTGLVGPFAFRNRVSSGRIRNTARNSCFVYGVSRVVTWLRFRGLALSHLNLTMSVRPRKIHGRQRRHTQSFAGTLALVHRPHVLSSQTSAPIRCPAWHSSHDNGCVVFFSSVFRVCLDPALFSYFLYIRMDEKKNIAAVRVVLPVPTPRSPVLSLQSWCGWLMSLLLNIPEYGRWCCCVAEHYCSWLCCYVSPSISLVLRIHLCGLNVIHAFLYIIRPRVICGDWQTQTLTWYPGPLSH